MKQRMFTRRLLVLAVTCVLIAAGCGGDDGGTTGAGGTGGGGGQQNGGSADGDPIRIGMVESLSGPGAPVGIDTKQGVQLAVEEINDDGGIDGRPIEIVEYDGQSDENQSRTLVQRVLSEDDVVALIGPAQSNLALVTMQLSSRANVLHLVGSQSPAVTAEDIPSLFRVAANEGNSWPRLAQALADAEVTSVGVMGDTTSLGDTTIPAIEDALDEAGIEYSIQRYERGAADLTAQLSRFSDVEAVIGSGIIQDVANMAKGLSRLGIDATLLASTGAYSAAFPDLAGGDANGTIVVSQLQPDKEEAVALAERWRERFDQADDAYLNPIIVAGYDAMMLLAEALRNAGDDISRETVLEAFQGLSGVTTVGGSAGSTVDFTQGQDAFTVEDMAFIVWRDGRPEPLPDEDFATALRG